MIEEIQKWREAITQIDNNIESLLAQRFEFCQKIGEIKQKYNLPIFDKNREDEILSKAKYPHIFKEIMKQGKQEQKQLMK